MMMLLEERDRRCGEKSRSRLTLKFDSSWCFSPSSKITASKCTPNLDGSFWKISGEREQWILLVQERQTESQ
jgi:hypothetical protein